jgi:flagellar basal-body rod modification protein FlgD
MSAIDSLASATRPATNAYESMSSDDFIRVMFAELTRQDPTKPTDSKDLLSQLGAIRGIESDLTLTNRLQDIARQNEITSAGSLVGAFVEGTTGSGEKTRGFVDSISVTREGILLNLSSTISIPLSGLQTVYDPDLITTAPRTEPAEEQATTPQEESSEEARTQAPSL